VVKIPLPALCTCQLGLNTPRYPTLPNIMKARKKELTTLDIATLAEVSPLAATEQIAFPERRKAGLVLEGEVGEVANRLVSLIKERTAIRR
jgi:electron transfer flavoprotein beta subunit